MTGVQTCALPISLIFLTFLVERWENRVDVSELIQRKLPISTIQRKIVVGGKVKLKSIRVR